MHVLLINKDMKAKQRNMCRIQITLKPDFRIQLILVRFLEYQGIAPLLEDCI
jgi:hypothetical protein